MLVASCITRILWFMEPYFIASRKSHLFFNNAKSHAYFSATLLRIGQLCMFIVLLLQIKSWRQTVRHSSKLKRTRSYRATLTYKNGKYTEDLFAIKLDNVVVTFLITMLVIAAILTTFFYKHTWFTYIAAIYTLLLIPSAVFYSYKLHELIKQLHSGMNVNNQTINESS